MKIRKDLIAVKNGNTIKYIKSDEIPVGDKTLADLFTEHEQLKSLMAELIDEIKDCYVVKKDTSYIVKIGDKLERIDKLELFEDTKTRLPLKMYKEKDGQIVVDKRKVSVL